MRYIAKKRLQNSFLFILILISSTSWGQSNTSITRALTPLAAETRSLTYLLAERPVTVREENYGATKDWVFVHLHGSEQTSLKAAQKVLPYTGGHLIKIENRTERNLPVILNNNKWQIDPNRIFSDTGIIMNLKELNKHKASPGVVNKINQFGEQVASLLPENSNCIIALHNNTDKHFSIKDYLPGGKRVRDAKKVFFNEEEDPDDIVLTTDSLIYEHMANACYNTILQDAVNVKKDGSLSVYAALRGKRYVNIETEHGREAQYVKMLEHLMLFLIREKESAYPSIPSEENQTELRKADLYKR